ncbi:mitochondrial import inner membrane translocase subunit Tim10 isoform X1 [Drosophila kikkawai]|uniref:Mitochondrial import inner membrane translocase subunit n=1 Tax=Drosophila kikkawai TaxID=30033 RepID=A0ABM4GCU8_DROKI
MALPQINSAADQAKLQLMQEMEVKTMSDLYNRMANACHKKCIPSRYPEPDLDNGVYDSRLISRISLLLPHFPGKGEIVCIDHCVAKFLDIHERIGKNLLTVYMPQEVKKEAI